MRSSLSICIFYASDALAQSLIQRLKDDSLGKAVGAQYSVTQFTVCQDFLEHARQETQHIDCLILQDTAELPSLLLQLHEQEVFFPTVIVQSDQGTSPFISDSSNNSVDAATLANSYHPAVLILGVDQLDQLGLAIEQAIGKFIQISPDQQNSDLHSPNQWVLPTVSLSLNAQQARLFKKLKERLGYLGVYYKRNPQNFLRHMSQFEREKLLRQLREEYREIILSYFSEETNLNQKLDNFVNVAFFADVPVAQIVEIHMDLMDEFAKQLKLEGRNDDILQDYRLTLIDTIAHLCEMYRRSIPRES